MGEVAGDRRTLREEARRVRAIPHRVRWAKAIAVALLAAGALDAASTEIALATGRVYEANPIVRMVQDALGGWWIAPKMAAHFGLAFAVVWFPNRPTLCAMGGVALLTAIVAANNFSIYASIVGGASGA